MTIDFKKIITSYFENVHARNSQGVANLFKPDGRLFLVDGRCLTGRAEIGEFYAQIFVSYPPLPRVTNMFGTGLWCGAELLVTLPDGKEQPAADFFHFEESGLIDTLTIYTREKTPV